MSIVYVCGSFRFLEEMNALEKRLKEEGIECMMPKSPDSQGILGCLRKIDRADVVYVVNPEGYVGKSVCVDIGYAYAKKKAIYTVHPIDDSIMRLITGVLSFEELVVLIRHCQRNREGQP